MSERPRSKDIPKVAANWALPADYERAVIARERDFLLPWVNKPSERRDDVYFATNRDLIAQLAWPYLSLLLQQSEQPRQVLEIGGGEGKAILSLIQRLSEHVPSLPVVTFTMTSLTQQPEHVDLISRGVNLRIPQIAERMPTDWTEQFDIIMTSAVFGWANANFAIPEINRILRPGGYWVGLEVFDGTPIYEGITLQGLIHSVMVDQQMDNTVSYSEHLDYIQQHHQFPVVYRKE